jgi:hypothetical protein
MEQKPRASKYINQNQIELKAKQTNAVTIRALIPYSQQLTELLSDNS